MFHNIMYYFICYDITQYPGEAARSGPAVAQGVCALVIMIDIINIIIILTVVIIITIISIVIVLVC